MKICIRCNKEIPAGKTWMLLLGMDGKEIAGFYRWPLCGACHHNLRNWLTGGNG